MDVIVEFTYQGYVYQHVANGSWYMPMQGFQKSKIGEENWVTIPRDEFESTQRLADPKDIRYTEH